MDGLAQSAGGGIGRAAGVNGESLEFHCGARILLQAHHEHPGPAVRTERTAKRHDAAPGDIVAAQTLEQPVAVGGARSRARSGSGSCDHPPSGAARSARTSRAGSAGPRARPTGRMRPAASLPSTGISRSASATPLDPARHAAAAHRILERSHQAEGERRGQDRAGGRHDRSKARARLRELRRVQHDQPLAGRGVQAVDHPDFAVRARPSSGGLSRGKGSAHLSREVDRQHRSRSARPGTRTVAGNPRAAVARSSDDAGRARARRRIPPRVMPTLSR